MRVDKKFHADGSLIESKTYDLDADVVTVVDANGNETVEALDPAVKETMRRQERESAQIHRLRQSLADLKDAPQLKIATYKLADGDLRDAARQINELRSAVKDLIRIVLILEAE